ncbi:dehydrogenase [Rhizocola hellebori]|uniref:Dehydrogenase n=1 Tax=Rhizocola hellebori TaxID=1392758 RepID=A0A8J3QBR6_9ACTN|nr:YciI family protein [Rhizocola hellebori]GIH06977.1 dehydrogenase [Rhizocola hellebori]
MRVMVLIKSDELAEAGQLPEQEMITGMIKFSEELVEAGVMLAGEGLHPSARGAKVNWTGGKVTVVDGPFTETKEIIAGYWLWQVNSMEEAIEWVKRMPASGKQDGTIEIREIFETAEFGDHMTDEQRERNERMRAQLGQ